MDDNHPDFFNHVAILTEASRINPAFGREVEAASTDERIDQLVEQGKAIIDEQADQAWV